MKSAALQWSDDLPATKTVFADRELLEQALMHADGNKSAAARLRGMRFSTFRDKLARHGLLQE